MFYKDEIGTGWELGDKLWSGARTNFDKWIEKDVDPEDILNAVEELLGYGEELPSLTEINDLIWFEPEAIEEFLGFGSNEEDEEIESSRKAIKSESNWNKRVQEIMDEEGVTREEAEDILADACSVKSGCGKKGKKKTADERAKDEGADITAARKPVKSAWYDDDEPLPFDPNDVDTITAEDIREAREAIENNPQSTWYKVLYTFDDGDELCLTAGMRDAEDWGEEGYMPCMCLGILPNNSMMSEYGFDFIMPYDKETADVWDTEVSDFSESDLDWFNKEAVNMAQEVSEGKWSKE